MMEQAHLSKRHHHSILIAALDNYVVADRAAGLCDVLNAGLLRSLDIVREGEECIRAEGNAVDGIKVGSLLLLGEGRGLLGEVLLPVAVSANVLLVLIYVAVDNVISVGSAEGGLEGKVQYLVGLTKEPGVSLAACKTGAVNSRLLTCANTDSLSVDCKANRVRLSIFKSDKGNHQVANCALGHILVLSYDIGKERGVDLKVVSALSKVIP